MSYLSAVCRQLERFVGVIGTTLLAIFILLVWAEIGLRLFGASQLWVQEAAQFAFLWSVFLGASVAFRHTDHLVLDVLTLNDRAERFLAVGVDVVTLGFLVYLLVLGPQLDTDRQMSFLPFPKAVAWWSIPVMGGLGSLFVVERLVKRFVARKEPQRVQLYETPAADTGSVLRDGA